MFELVARAVWLKFRSRARACYPLELVICYSGRSPH